MSFKILAFLGLNATEYEQGMKAAQKAAEGLAAKMVTILKGDFLGGNAIADKLGVGKAFDKIKDLVDDLRERTKEAKIGGDLLNVDPDVFQRVKTITDAVGGSVEQVAKGFEKIAESQEKIKNGEDGWQKAAKNFAALGVSLQDLKTKSYQTVFFQIAESIKSAVIDSEKLAALHDVLGKGGVSLLPAFRRGFDSQFAFTGVLTDTERETQQKINEEEKKKKAPYKLFLESVGGLFAKAWGDFLDTPAKSMTGTGLVLQSLKKYIGLDQSPEVKKVEDELSKKRANQTESTQAKKEKDFLNQIDNASKQKEMDKMEKHFAMEAKRLDEEAEKENRNLEIKKMSNSERLKFYKDEIRALKERNSLVQQEVLMNGDDDKTKAAEMAMNRAQMAKDNSSIFDLMKKSKFDPKPLDNLAKIGGFSSGADTSAITELRAIKMTLDDIKQSSNITAKALNE